LKTAGERVGDGKERMRKKRRRNSDRNCFE
jgi:hypothetical protein